MQVGVGHMGDTLICGYLFHVGQWFACRNAWRWRHFPLFFPTVQGGTHLIKIQNY